MNDLEQLVNEYGEKKSNLDALTKEVKEVNNSIKTLMEEEHLEVAETEQYKVTYIVQKRMDWDEETLINTLNLWEVPGVVKTKQYVDKDALEDAIYNGRLNQDQLFAVNKCLTEKDVVTLRVKKK